MARPRKPANVIEMAGKTHLSKADLEKRKNSEVKAEADNVHPPGYLNELDPVEKWKLTVSFEAIALASAYHAAFYDKCALMRKEAKPVTFISPYDGQEKTVQCKCIERVSPEAVKLYQRRPWLYRGAGAVFQEI